MAPPNCAPPWLASSATPICGMNPPLCPNLTPPCVSPVNREFWGPVLRRGCVTNGTTVPGGRRRLVWNVGVEERCWPLDGDPMDRCQDGGEASDTGSNGSV
jgi:hypothetical protein